MVASWMMLPREAVNDANELIDEPDKWFGKRSWTNSLGIGHDDSRKFAMDVVRNLLRDLRGEAGIWAADLHYVLDWLEGWLIGRLVTTPRLMQQQYKCAFCAFRSKHWTKTATHVMKMHGRVSDFRTYILKEPSPFTSSKRINLIDGLEKMLERREISQHVIIFVVDNLLHIIDVLR